jgi:hypothetical protein
MKPPFLSVVVVTYDMYRELPRTLHSLSPQYQVGIDASDYEVIVVDNGSAVPPVADDFAHLGMDLTILTTPDATPSPAPAVNRGLNASVGAAMAVFIDGARMASPGLLAAGLEALSLSPRAVVGSRGRYLGYEIQRDAIANGYDQAAEDALLDSIDWMDDGYRLFTVSVFDDSCGPTWFNAMAESNSLFMWRTMWAELGGFDTAFTSSGGGLVNLDAWERARQLPGARAVALIGEATFHQVHGGVATNMPEDATVPMFAEYEQLRGRPFDIPTEPLALWGTFVVEPPVDEMINLDEPDEVSWLTEGRSRVGARVASHLPTSVRQQLRSTYRRLAPVITRTRAEAEAARRAEDDDADLLLASGLFDPGWYVATYPEVAAAGYDPVRHYLRFAVAEQRQPGPGFDGLWYANSNLDVSKARANPLVHYLRHGANEGRWMRVLDPVAEGANRGAIDATIDLIATSPLFDADWYQATYRDASRSGLAPPVHYVRLGRMQGHNPGPNFDAQRYLNDNPDVRVAGADPLVHYLTAGEAEGRAIHPVQPNAD